jgi:HAD superfamily hydrolase (TIGR01509 family)
MTSKIKAIAFDMDGLMFNTEDIYWLTGTELMRRRGKDYTEELCHTIMGTPPQNCFETMISWHGLSDNWEDMAAESEELFIGFLDEHLSPMEGLVDLLDAMEAAKLPKAICTSSSPTVLCAIVNRLGWMDRFDFTMTSADITHGKPHPEIYLNAIKRFGLEPHQVAAIEDSQTGTRSAAASGAYTISVPGDHSRHHDFTEASIVVDGLHDPRLYEVIGLMPKK